jgi:hypothetical protein
MHGFDTVIGKSKKGYYAVRFLFGNPTIGFTHQLCRITVGIIMKEVIQVCITASKRQTTLPHMIVVGEHYTLVK